MARRRDRVPMDLAAMPPSFRRDVIAGAVSGLAGGLMLGLAWQGQGMPSTPDGPISWGAFGTLPAYLLSAAVGGAAFGALFRYQPESPAFCTSGGLLFGLLWWIVGPLTLGALWTGHAPTWSARDAGAAFPSLVGDLLYGGVLGGAFYTLVGLHSRLHPPTDPPPRPSAGPCRHVVILGGGFGGVSAAQRLEQSLNRNREIKVTLVSQSNYLLFTPMLAEVAGGELEPQHIGVPLRAALPRTTLRRAEVEAIDTEDRIVRIRETPTAASDSLRYDHLVLALGSIPHYHGIPSLEAYSFPLKTLEDGVRLRNHVIAMLESANAEPHEESRRGRLTVVVAGGGFAGTEVIAELFDFVHSVGGFYQQVHPQEPRFVLVHSGERLLPELSPRLAEYALRKLLARGIEVLFNTRVTGAAASCVRLSDGRRLPARTLVWTAGNHPHPLLKTLPCERNRAGAVVDEATLQVKGHANVWAVGDCAQIPDLSNRGEPCPPTAQHAVRQGAAAAENVAASLTGQPARPFRFRTLGVLMGLGHHSAVAEWRGKKFSGPLAWFMWRTVYLSKLPGVEKKIRVALDWTIDLFFPRDIVLTAGPQSTIPPRTLTGTDEAKENHGIRAVDGVAEHAR
jgi:NADH:ubiquinone reductase (H+-translocating)